MRSNERRKWRLEREEQTERIEYKCGNPECGKTSYIRFLRPEFRDKDSFVPTPTYRIVCDSCFQVTDMTRVS